ncbi:MAG TPA: MarR family transcriptional regulator [Chroococcales cyanobacterium]
MPSDPMMLLIDLFCRRIEDLFPSREDLTWPQFQALRFLERHTNPSIGAIAESLGISNPAATKAVDRLVTRGWVDRSENPQDRRTLLLGLTASGEEILKSFLESRQNHLDRILEGMRVEERRALKRGLRSFLSSSFLENRPSIQATCLRCGRDHNPDCIVNQASIALLEQPLERI